MRMRSHGNIGGKSQLQNELSKHIEHKGLDKIQKLQS